MDCAGLVGYAAVAALTVLLYAAYKLGLLYQLFHKVIHTAYKHITYIACCSRGDVLVGSGLSLGWSAGWKSGEIGELGGREGGTPDT